MPSFWFNKQTVLGNTQTVNTNPNTVVIGSAADRVYSTGNNGVLQVTAPKNSVAGGGFDKNMGIFLTVDNTTNLYAGTGVMQFWSALNTAGFLAINPAGGGVAINTPFAGGSELALIVGANPSNNGFLKLQNSSSYGGGATPYTGVLFQQSVGAAYTKAGIMYDAYDGTGGGYGRGRLLFCVNGVLDSSNVQDTIVASTRMNIDYVGGVITIGQGVTVGTGKLNVTSTTEQQRWYYNTSNYANITVGSTGAVSLDAAGSGAKFNFLKRLNIPSLAATTVEGDLWLDSTQKALSMFVDGIQQQSVGCIFAQTADATVSNTVTETTILASGVGTKTLPANFFVAGKTIRLRVGGVYSTPALATPSIIIKVKYGSTVIATVTTSALLSGATNLEFDGEVLITCRSTGASGTVMTHGDIEYSTGVAGTIGVDSLNNAGATTTINTTTSNALDVTIQWDSATATRGVKSTTCTIEVLN